jgi:hypothetical protein
MAKSRVNPVAEPTAQGVVADGIPPAPNAGPWRVGRAYLIRTVTYFVLGRLTAVYEHELVLEEASWVADTGRFHECLKTGKLAEVEPFVSPVIVGRSSVCDSTEWTHALPTKVA